ncbi:hypothetical protein AMTRI_Chr06g192820 [Amborella trichopoda]
MLSLRTEGSFLKALSQWLLLSRLSLWFLLSRVSCSKVPFLLSHGFLSCKIESFMLFELCVINPLFHY